MKSALKILSWKMVAGLLLAAAPMLPAKDAGRPDRELALLRGEWEYHTARQRWTLDFQTDRALMFDRYAVKYELVGDTLRVQSEDGTTDYPYALSGDGLSLTYPDGKTITFEHKTSGVSEKYLTGQYLASGSKSGAASVTYYGDGTFRIDGASRTVSPAGKVLGGSEGNDPGSDAAMTGVYRVDGEAVVLAFDDGSVGEANVRMRDEEGMALTVGYNGDLFNADVPAAPPVEKYTSAPVQAGSCQPPILIGGSTIPTVPPAVLLGGQGSDTGSAQKNQPAKTDQRTFGSTRGTTTRR